MRARLGADVARALADDIVFGAYELVPLATADVARCTEIDRTYADLGIGLTDASVIAIAKREEADHILTLDQRHFRAVRRSAGRHCVLLPDDG